MVKPEKAALVWNYLEDYWPCAGGLSEVNAIGTQMRDLINNGREKWQEYMRQIQPESGE